jgi:hypothetical protein
LNHEPKKQKPDSINGIGRRPKIKFGEVLLSKLPGGPGVSTRTLNDQNTGQCIPGADHIAPGAIGFFSV